MAETDQIDVHMGLHARGTTSGGVNENFIPNFADVKAGHNFIVFSGSGTSSGGDANAVAHMFEKWLPQKSGRRTVVPPDCKVMPFSSMPTNVMEGKIPEGSL